MAGFDGSKTHGGLTLERFAEVSAELRKHPSARAGDVLAELGVTDAAFRAATAGWNQAIEDEVSGGGDALVLAFSATMKRARAAPPIPLPVAAEPVAQHAPPPAVLAAASVAAPVVIIAPAPPSRVAHTPLGMTLDAVMSPFAAPTLPFTAPAPGAPSPAAIPAPPVAAEPAAQHASPSRVAHTPMGMTLDAVMSPFAAPTLPFTAPAPGAPSPAAIPAPPPSSPRPAGAPPPSARAPSPPASAQPPPSSPSSARAPSPPASAQPPSAPATAVSPRFDPLPRFTLEQFTSLVAELTVHPQQQDAVLTKYGVPSAAAWAALKREWDARLLSDPALQARWLELDAQYRAWLLSRGG